MQLITIMGVWEQIREIACRMIRALFIFIGYVVVGGIVVVSFMCVFVSFNTNVECYKQKEINQIRLACVVSLVVVQKSSG